jgi:hypothetical protein
MQFRDGSSKGTASIFVQILKKTKQKAGDPGKD